MENIIVVFRYMGKLDFPDDPEQALIQAPAMIEPLFKTGQFELITAGPWHSWEATHRTDYTRDLTEQSCILEIKMEMAGFTVGDSDTITKHIAQGLQNGRFIVERIDENEGPGVLQSLVTLSEAVKHKHYLVEFRVPGQLEAVTQKAGDDQLVQEIIMLLQSGDVELVDFQKTHAFEYDNHCEDTEVDDSHTLFEIRVKLNEFNIELHDPETVYYNVIDQLNNCKPIVTYCYRCGDEPFKTIIGVDVFCPGQSPAIDDNGNLIQQI